MDRGGARSLHHARPGRVGVVLLLLWAGIGLGQDAEPAAGPEQAAARFLAGKYPPQRGFRARSASTPDFDPGAAIRAVPPPRVLEPRIPESRRLEARMPDARFYATAMRGPQGFPVVPAIVAVVRAPDGTWRGAQECLDPQFLAPNPEFLALFRGVATDSDAERVRIGVEIATLFQEATTAGQIWRARYADRQFTGELWIRNEFDRTVAVRFDAAGRVQDVRLVAPPRPPQPVGPRPDLPK